MFDSDHTELTKASELLRELAASASASGNVELSGYLRQARRCVLELADEPNLEPTPFTDTDFDEALAAVEMRVRRLATRMASSFGRASLVEAQAWIKAGLQTQSFRGHGRVSPRGQRA